MPKEITYSDSPQYWRDADGNEVPIREDGSSRIIPDEDGGGVAYPLFTEDLGPLFRRGVHVGWGKNYVEVGVAEFEQSTERMVTERGTFTSLDRAGINRAIRSLQRARDKAYGKDA